MQSSLTIVTASATPSASSSTSILAHAQELLLQLLRWRFCSSNSGKKLAEPVVSDHNIAAIALVAIAILTRFNYNYATCSSDLIQVVNVIPDQGSFSRSSGYDGATVC